MPLGRPPVPSPPPGVISSELLPCLLTHLQVRPCVRALRDPPATSAGPAAREDASVPGSGVGTPGALPAPFRSPHHCPGLTKVCREGDSSTRALDACFSSVGILNFGGFLSSGYTEGIGVFGLPVFGFVSCFVFLRIFGMLYSFGFF